MLVSYNMLRLTFIQRLNSSIRYCCSYSRDEYNRTEHSVKKQLEGYTKTSGNLAATKFGVKLHLIFTVKTNKVQI